MNRERNDAGRENLLCEVKCPLSYSSISFLRLSYASEKSLPPYQQFLRNGNWSKPDQYVVSETLPGTFLGIVLLLFPPLVPIIFLFLPIIIL